MTLSTPSLDVPSATADDRRDSLARDVEAQLLSWSTRAFIGAFRRWHQDAFSLLHLNVLTVLEADGPLPMSRLAEALDVSVASTTGIVDRMAKRGLVERRHSEADRRLVLVHPTERGRGVFDRIDERRREGLARLLTHLSETELEALLVGHRALGAARAAVAAERDGAAHGPSAGVDDGRCDPPTAEAAGAGAGEEATA